MDSSLHITPESLVAHGGWMRDLASSLLADAGAADDVVQEAWIAAMRRPPAEERALEPWLARVVRNLAWKRRRSEQRRVEHETRSASTEPSDSAHDTLERIETQRILVEAVAALGEPLRTTVVLRWFEGLSSVEIARRTNVPEGTVRWRLKSALDELRERLDRRFGSRESWSAWLLPWSVDPASLSLGGAASSAVWIPGVLTMGLLAKLAAAVVVVAAVGVWWWSEAREGQASSLEARSAAATLEPDEPLALESSVVFPGSKREDVAPAERASETPAEVAPQAAPAAATPATPAARLEMRFVDRNGRPWSGVRVSALGEDAPASTSDSEGHAVFESRSPSDFETQWSVELYARRDACATRHWYVTAHAGASSNLGEIVLGPGVRVSGRVVDQNGRARGGVDVGLAPESFDVYEGEARLRRHGTSAFDRVIATRSAPDGSFVLDGVALGRARVWGRAEESRFGWSEVFEAQESIDVVGVELVVPDLLDTDLITGVVLDPDGKPVPRAAVSAYFDVGHESGMRMRHADATGHFEILVELDTSYAIVAADDSGRFAPAAAFDVAQGTRGLELRLGAAGELLFDVRDSEGNAVRGAVLALAPWIGDSTSFFDARPRELEAGRYAAKSPGLPFSLEVSAAGLRPRKLERLEPSACVAPFEVVLERASRLRGQVVVAGRPIAGARVTSHAAIEQGWMTRDGFDCLYDPNAADSLTTAAAGTFEITASPGELLWLRAEAPGWAAADLGPIRVPDERELVLELTAGGAIEGRVLLPDGRDGEGTVVGVNRGDGEPRTVRAGPGGAFRFEGLAPGNWQVQRCERELDPHSRQTTRSSQDKPTEWPCTVHVGRVTRFDLDLTER